MQQWKSVDEVLDFAIGQEEQAAQFYRDLAGRMDRPWMSKIFTDFSQEEEGHKRKLLSSAQKVMDLKIGDYLTYVEP